MDSMNCTEFEQSLNRAVESRSEADLRNLRDHAAGCALCRGLWHRFTLLQQAIPHWKADVPDVDLADSVILRVAAAEPVAVSSTSKSFRERWATAMVVAAAACMMAFVLWPAPVANNQPAPQNGAVAVEQPRNVKPREAPQTPVMASRPQLEDRAVRKGGDAIMVLAENAASTMVKTPMFLPPAGALSLAEPEEGEEAPASSWIAEWSQDLQPIGREVGNAMNFLLDAVPLDPAPTM